MTKFEDFGDFGENLTKFEDFCDKSRFFGDFGKFWENLDESRFFEGFGDKSRFFAGFGANPILLSPHDLIDRLLQRLPAGDSDRTPLKKYKHPKSDQSDQADPQSAVANFTASDGWDRNSSNGQNGGKGNGKGKGKGYPNGKWQNPSKAKPGERPRDGFSEPARNDQAGVRGQYSPCNSPGRSAEGERSRCAICRSTTHSTEEHRGPSRKGKGNQSGSSSSSSNSQSAGGSPKSKRGGSN